MPDGGQNHREDGTKAQADEDRRANGHGNAKSAHALQEGGQEEGDGEHLQAAVAGKVGDRVADHADGADLVCQAVEQERAPDDVEQVEGEEDRFDLRPGEDLPGAAEECQADDDGHDPTGGAGAHPSPFKSQHEDHDGQDGQKGEQPG